MFGYHPIDNYVTPPVIDIPLPKIVHLYDDDYSKPFHRLHLFDPYDQPPPVIYLPRVHVAPEIYIDDLHPYAHRFQEPPHLNRLWTTLTYTYNTRVVPVIDKEKEEEHVADSNGSDSDVVPQVVKNKGATKKDKNAETTTSSVKKVTPKPETEAVTKSDTGEKSNVNKTAESKVDTKKISENDDADVESKPVEEETKTVDATSDSATPDDGNADTAATENSEGSTTDVEVPAA